MMFDDLPMLVSTHAFAYFNVHLDHETAKVIADRIREKEGKLEILIREELVRLNLMK